MYFCSTAAAATGLRVAQAPAALMAAANLRTASGCWLAQSSLVNQTDPKKRFATASYDLARMRTLPAASASDNAGSPSWAASTRPAATASIIAFCGNSVYFTLCESAPFASSHASTATSSSPRTCVTATVLPARSLASWYGELTATTSALIGVGAL